MYLICEIGSNHNNDPKRIEKLIAEAAEVGFSAVKFQLFKADKMYKEAAEDLRESELDTRFFPMIRNLCTDHKIELGCSVFYQGAIKEINEYVDFWKISSFDFKRTKLIEACLKTKKPIIISLGLAGNSDVIYMMAHCESFCAANKLDPRMISFMHCNSKYPCPPEEAKLNRIDFLRYLTENRYPIGYSDHTANIMVLALAMFLCNDSAVEIHYDLEDLQGAETKHGHCAYRTRIEAAEYIRKGLNQSFIGEWKPDEDMLKLLANEKTGFRGE